MNFLKVTNKKNSKLILVTAKGKCQHKSIVKWLSHVQLFVTPWTVAYQAPSLVHGIFQVRVLEWVAISFSSTRPYTSTNAIILN